MLECCPAYLLRRKDRPKTTAPGVFAATGEESWGANCADISAADRGLPGFIAAEGMAGKPSSSTAAGAPGAVVVAAAVAVGLVVGAGGLMAVLLLRERGNKAATGETLRVWWTDTG